MNIKIKRGILAFVICIVLGTIDPVTIGNPGEDPNSIREKLRQDPNYIRAILHRAVENAKTGDREELHSVIQSIGKPYEIYTSDKLLPDYISFLNDKDGDVQVLGATCLCSLKSPKSVDALVKYLQSKDFSKLEKMVSAGEVTEQDALCYLWAAPMAIMALGEIGDKSVIPFLESLRNIDFHLEWGWGPVEEALAKLGALKSLSSVPAGADERQIGRTEHAIRSIKDPNLAPELMAMVRNKMVALSTRCAAMYALGGIISPGIAEFLFEVINDSNCPEGLRLSAADSAVTMVSRTKDPIAEKRLLVYAENPSSNIRPNVLLQLAICMPDKYLGRWFETIMDTNEDPEFRNKLVEMEGATFPSISIYMHDILEAHRDLLYNCLNASDKNGRPMDKIREETWRIINKILHEAHPLELIDEKSKYPKLLREAAAEEAGRTRPTGAEQALLKVLDDPNCDIRIGCLYGLAKLNSEKYVPKILNIVFDKSAPFAEREELSDKMANAMEPKKLKPHAEMLRMGIQAVKKDGSPADTIRVYMWKALHRATGEEPPLELMDGRLAYDKLRFDFETKFTRENVHTSADEIRRMVDEKIKSIVVKWQPPKEGEKP